ncbi:hypothetical protein RAJCM14343_2215 [Rhodococcus aetherivorans]|uniref:Uncharacterized protein n=1 Tax=Rhodococcus aetherivorans TaxID=191292 RepID=A0ABQ0YKE2_9NOCA|nr:hypothetical protein RAJCM14343_2215 [Rhodococcus aetherivorans]CCW11186.1 hypothetical protein EBESD8_17220 [Rhodococcus aetherivorans]
MGAGGVDGALPPAPTGGGIELQARLHPGQQVVPPAEP